MLPTRFFSRSKIRNDLTFLISNKFLSSLSGEIKRADFTVLKSKHFSFFKTLLGESRVVTDPFELERPNTDWLRSHRGRSGLLLKPKNTTEMSEILKYCNSEYLAVCPQGGNTGFSVGSIPIFDEVIISTSLMNQILSFDENAGHIICESGCILSTLNDYLDDRDMILPLDLASKGSCQIGGNIATNAGGLRVMRYGNIHGNLLGLEAVLADGTILSCLNTMKKDNTGYDLKQLFVGSEGTLGILTKVAIQCMPKLKATNLLFLSLNSFENVLKTLKWSRVHLAEIISCCEYMDDASMNVVIENLRLENPLGRSPFYMLIETSGSNEEHDRQKLNIFLEHLTNRNIVSDGTIAADMSQASRIWELRERIPEALLKEDCVHAFDFSIPITRFNQLVEETRMFLGSAATRCVGFGHLGDGNVHVGFSMSNDPSLSTKVNERMYEWVAKHGGSISAEHGIGFKNRNYLSYAKSPEAIRIMKNIKSVFDHKGILNPYKVFPDSDRHTY